MWRGDRSLQHVLRTYSIGIAVLAPQPSVDPADVATLHAALLQQARALVDGERDPIANAANLSSLIYHTLPDLNWAGFYFLRGNELVLGPFQGMPACIRIALGRGVCGTAAAERRSILVADVHAFPGHIACDARSRSEVVLPLLDGERVIGVLDLDSPLVGRFTDADREVLEAVAALYVGSSNSL